jgi:Alw26I/Eco31I/Esp3I family type II restriction m6 adenine DNA methyltransferase
MHHLEVTHQHLSSAPETRRWIEQRAAGRFYTARPIADHLVGAVQPYLAEASRERSELRLVDPFCGDGRLIAWMFEALCAPLRSQSWNVELWDIDPEAVLVAAENVRAAASRLGIRAITTTRVVDAFRIGPDHLAQFDLVLTNPPWELLKPDSRELARLPLEARQEYVSALRSQDSFLAQQFPRSQPKRKFAGWGTNLARAGVDLSVQLAAHGGLAAIVSPPSIFADDNSLQLREWLFSQNALLDAAYFPAEMKLFRGADVTASTLLIKRARHTTYEAKLSSYFQSINSPTTRAVDLCVENLRKNSFLIPISLDPAATETLSLFKGFPSFGDLETDETEGLWAGREVDETRIRDWFRQSGAPFLKGRAVGRYSQPSPPPERLSITRYRGLPSIEFERIAWRDVSRPNQKRRVQATVIPRDWVTGNSLHVAYFRNRDNERLHALLAVVNSLAFEFQARARLATGHISLSVVRQVRLPSLAKRSLVTSLSKLAERCLRADSAALVEAEVRVAQAYDLSRNSFSHLLEMFPKLSAREKEAMLKPELWAKRGKKPGRPP